MNLPSSEQLLNDLLATLEKEIAQDEEAINKLNFALKVKKARFKKLKTNTKEK